MLFFNKGLIRRLIIWKTLHFKALSHIWFPKVNGPALLKERWRRFLIFSTPKVVGHNRVLSREQTYPLFFVDFFFGYVSCCEHNL